MDEVTHWSQLKFIYFQIFCFFFLLVLEVRIVIVVESALFKVIIFDFS